MSLSVEFALETVEAARDSLRDYRRTVREYAEGCGPDPVEAAIVGKLADSIAEAAAALTNAILRARRDLRAIR